MLRNVVAIARASVSLARLGCRQKLARARAGRNIARKSPTALSACHTPSVVVSTWSRHAVLCLHPACSLVPGHVPRTQPRNVGHYLLLGEGCWQMGSSEKAAPAGPSSSRAAAFLRSAAGAASSVAALRMADSRIQPYPDGLSSRRSSLMASLALGVPVVSNRSALTDDFWVNQSAVVLAAEATRRSFAACVAALLSRDERLAELRVRRAQVYEAAFSLVRTVGGLWWSRPGPVEPCSTRLRRERRDGPGKGTNG